jgi:hypothetical protein
MIKMGAGWIKPNGNIGISLNGEKPILLVMSKDKFKKGEKSPDYVLFRYVPQDSIKADETMVFELKTVKK